MSSFNSFSYRIRIITVTVTVPIMSRSTLCTGCLENQPNQMAHMDPPYGCLCTQSKDDEDTLESLLACDAPAPAPPTNNPPVVSVPCPICSKQICRDINVTVTACSHTFHSDCLLKSVDKNNSCPVCQCKLFEKPKETAYEYDHMGAFISYFRARTSTTTSSDYSMMSSKHFLEANNRS